MQSAPLLQRIATGWDKRARVRSPIDLELEFQQDKDDFLEEHLPFKTHPLFTESSTEHRTKILTCGWIAYNTKTIMIETDIVHPICTAILAEQFDGVADFITKQLVTETLVDESYHIHLCTYGNEIAKCHRKIHLQLPQFQFINRMRACQDEYAEPWKKSLIQLAASVASEIYITDYLALVSKETTHQIQPLHSLIVKTHRQDELVHGKIFTHLAHAVFSHLDQKQKTFFAEMMPKPLAWLSDLEFDLWLTMLEQIKFPRAKEMLEDCQTQAAAHHLNNIHENAGTADLVTLAQDIGVMDFAIGREAFQKEGITL